MSVSDPYVLVAAVILVAVIILAFVLGRSEAHNRITRLTGLAFAFVVAGLVFGTNRLVGYGLLGIGVVLAVIDIFQHRK